MSDYTLLEAALGLGGRVAVVYTKASEDGQPASVSADCPPAACPLSKAHISPFVEYRAGASLLKAHRGGMKDDQVGGGLRGSINGFSDNSRRRLMYTIGGIRLDAELPLFITLTYPMSFPEPKQAKKHLDTFFKRLARAFPAHGSIWKLEPQERGAPHFHILTWGCELEKIRAWLPLAWHEIAGNGDRLHLLWHEGKLGNGNRHCVQQVRTWRGVWSYASKYLGKTFDVAGWSEKWTGRFWGVIHRGHIPFGELIEEEVTRKKAVEIMRYQKRFSGLNKRNNKSMTIFCDADQWIKKVGLSES